MFRKCCVPECRSLRQDVKFHGFPKCEEMKRKWLECIGGENFGETKNMYVCHKHFEDRFVNVTNHLKKGAYPTLFSSLEISSGRSSSDSTKTDPCGDHSYSRKRHIDHTYSLPYEPPNKIVRAEVSVVCGLPATPDQLVPVATCTSKCNTPDTQILSMKDQMPVPHPTISLDIATGSVCKTPRKVVKRRLIGNAKTLTPKCRLLYSEFKKARMQKNYFSRVKKALVFSKCKSFEDITKKMNPLSQKVLLMQMRLCMKKKMARRFTTEEKLIALSIYKQGPKSYKFLQKIFILPSKTTLKNMISQLNIGTGINSQILELMKNQIKTWDSNKRLCSILLDEMALETAVTYAANKDDIVGFVDINGKTNDFADHVLVFMLRGAIYKWQQPLAFYFCEGATRSVELVPLIKEVVAAITEIGLKPIALVSDQGTNFQSAFNILLEESKRRHLAAEVNFDNTIDLSGNTLSVFYDPPHLIKGIRNNWLTKEMIFEGKPAKWQDIVDVYNADCRHGQSRILHKLTDQHVIPEKIKKMKVKNCVRVLSKTVSAALSYTSRFPLYPDGTPVSATMKNTANAISFFDDLFDSVNGASLLNKRKKAKTLSTAVTAKTAHSAYWSQAIKTLQNISFQKGGNNFRSIPSLKNWVVTLKSFQRVWGSLQKQEIKILRPRYFNSDPLENFFGQVRAYNYRSNDPSPYTFINTFKSLLITRFINFHSETFNCENVSSQDLLNIQSLFEKPENVNTAPVTCEASSTEVSNQEASVELDNEQIISQARRERLNIHSRAYTVGWVTRKIFSKINCDLCRTNLISSDESSVHTYIKDKEYKSMKNRKLTYPTEAAVIHFGKIINCTNEYLEVNGHHQNIQKKIGQKIVKENSFDFLNCKDHKNIVLELFVSLSVKLFIFNWCNVINKILKGTDVARLDKLKLPPIQCKALKKFKKKLKNKKYNK